MLSRIIKNDPLPQIRVNTYIILVNMEAQVNTSYNYTYFEENGESE